MGNRKLKQQKRRMGTLERKPKQKEIENIQETENTNKKYSIFQIETNNKIINMEVDKTKYDHYQTLSPFHQKCLQNLMTLELLKQKYGD